MPRKRKRGKVEIWGNMMRRNLRTRVAQQQRYPPAQPLVNRSCACASDRRTMPTALYQAAHRVHPCWDRSGGCCRYVQAERL